MVDYVAESTTQEYFIPWAREYEQFTIRPGAGYLGGDPGGLTTVSAIPASATVRILYRPNGGEPGDGVVVAETVSAPDGTWRVTGLDPTLKYDVVGRKAGFKDVIVSNVSPLV